MHALADSDSHLPGSPLIATFDITYRCNLNCVMCHAPAWAKAHGSEPELSRDKIISTARRLTKEHGIGCFRFLGGEPRLREDLPDIIREVSSFAATVTTTNGLLLDKDMCATLVDAGLGVLNVSLDGPRENCDALRGEGTYERVVQGIRTFLYVRRERGSSKPAVSVGNIVTKLNLRRLGEVASFIRSLGADWDFWPIHHLYEKARETHWNGDSCGFEHPAPAQAKQLLLDEAEQEIYWAEYFRALRRYTRPGSARMAYGWLGPIKRRVSRFRSRGYRDCLRIQNHLIIGPRGEVFPCEFLRRVPVGNVRGGASGLWDTPERRELRAAVGRGDLAICRECDRRSLYRDRVM